MILLRRNSNLEHGPNSSRSAHHSKSTVSLWKSTVSNRSRTPGNSNTSIVARKGGVHSEATSPRRRCDYFQGDASKHSCVDYRSDLSDTKLVVPICLSTSKANDDRYLN